MNRIPTRLLIAHLPPDSVICELLLCEVTLRAPSPFVFLHCSWSLQLNSRVLPPLFAGPPRSWFPFHILTKCIYEQITMATSFLYLGPNQHLLLLRLHCCFSQSKVPFLSLLTVLQVPCWSRQGLHQHLLCILLGLSLAGGLSWRKHIHKLSQRVWARSWLSLSLVLMNKTKNLWPGSSFAKQT